MKCSKCGAEIAENDKFCKECGEIVKKAEEETKKEIEVENNENVEIPVLESKQETAVDEEKSSKIEEQKEVKVEKKAEEVEKVQPVAEVKKEELFQSVKEIKKEEPVQSKVNATAPIKKKKNKFLRIVILVLILVIAAAITAVATGLVKFKFTIGDYIITNKETVEEKGNTTNNDDKNNKKIDKKKNYEADIETVSGYNFEIDPSYEHKVSGTVLYVNDEDETWKYTFEVDGNTTVEKVKKNEEKYRKTFKNNNLDMSSFEYKTIDSVKYLVAELSKGENAFILAFVEVNGVTVAINVANEDYTIDYDLLSDAYEIAETVTKE